MSPKKTPILVNKNINNDFNRISDLTTNTETWVIKARVTKKSDPFYWSNAKGKGQIMNIELIDKFGD